ncbi:GNAT family N-acetyltransferase [Nonomuraea sp. NPDC050643]|uniref:GNAT family N-acetyltransferase n=1 Tax=Nonomuraea sp. NPDC050643 TaxID=3155660 RepID=UPI003410F51E
MTNVAASDTAISIRPATAGDAGTVHRLMRELAGHQGQEAGLSVTVDRLREFLGRPEVTYLLAERDGRALGYVSWFDRPSLWSGDDYLALDDLYVCAGERGAGVGELLMRAAAGLAAGRVIRWEVGESNKAAQRFYERIGATLTSKLICRWRVEA